MASKDLNKTMLIGRLGADPEMRYTGSGTPVTSFRIAVNRNTRQGDEAGETTDWFSVVAWQKLAEICSQYLTKGSRVYIEGRLQTRSYEGNDGQKRYVTEVVASDMIMLDTRGQQTGEAVTAGVATNTSTDSLFDDDIPF